MQISPHSVQSQAVSLNEALLPALFPLLQIHPRLPAPLTGQPPPGQVCGRTYHSPLSCCWAGHDDAWAINGESVYITEFRTPGVTPSTLNCSG